MTLKQIEELEAWVGKLRGQGQVPSSELERLAKAVGRTKEKRGKHPIYVSSGRPPLSIPHHGRPMKRRTKDSILTTIESDLAIKKEQIENERNRQNGRDAPARKERR